MKQLARYLNESNKGPLIPPPWPSLTRYITPRPGQMHVVIGAPGAGKSTFALEWGVSMAQRGEPVLYLSLDTPIADQAARLVARMRNKTVREVQANLSAHAEWLSELYLPMRFSDLPMSVDEVADLVEAETSWFGRPPRLIVIDNAGDLIQGEEGPQEFAKVFRSLRNLSLAKECVVIALHHIKRGEAANGKIAPSMSDGVYGGERPASSVLGVWRPYENKMNVAILKNRHGANAADGTFFLTLEADMEKAHVYERVGGVSG